MKKLIPILVFVLATISSYAQSWNPYTPGVVRYFTNPHGYLRFMRIDSVAAFGSDLVYYPFRSGRADKFGLPISFEFTAGSWLGEHVYKKTDGSFIIPNYWNDTILLKPQAVIGDTWVFYHDNSSIYYKAEVVSKDTMTISGASDSIKKIVLTAYDGLNVALSDSFNNAEIVLSKSHGFYKIIDIYRFPYHAPGSTDIFNDYYLFNAIRPANINSIYNLDNPDTPDIYNSSFVQFEYARPTPTDMYNWSVGDIREYSECEDYSPNWGTCDEPLSYRLDTVISRTVVDTGVWYVLHGWQAYFDTIIAGHQVYDVSPVLDTVFVPDSGTALNFFMMPEEDPLFTFYGQLNYCLPNDTSHCFSGTVHIQGRYYDVAVVDYSVFKEGPGLVKRFLNYTDIVNRRQNLIYSQRNGVSCGSYHFPDTSAPVINHIAGIYETGNIKVYPNPAYEQLIIQTQLSAYKLSLINTIGQVVLEKEACNNKQIIDIGDFTNGVYYLKLKTADHEVMTRKVIIQH